MPELSSYLGQSAGKYGSLSSPYPRQTQSEIEIDCNCVDILNILERRDLQREVLDFSLASQENFKHPLASNMSPKVEIPLDFFGQLMAKVKTAERVSAVSFSSEVRPIDIQ